MKTKTCKKCNQTKTAENFFNAKNSSDGLYSTCKVCKQAATYLWREKNKDKYNEGAKRWRQNNPEKEYHHEIKRRYGITGEEYNALLYKQNYACAICGYKHDATKNKGRLYVDHCHVSGHLRQLLCGACNSGLGYFKDNTDLLRAAIDYLKRNKQEE